MSLDGYDASVERSSKWNTPAGYNTEPLTELPPKISNSKLKNLNIPPLDIPADPEDNRLYSPLPFEVPPIDEQFIKNSINWTHSSSGHRNGFTLDLAPFTENINTISIIDTNSKSHTIWIDSISYQQTQNGENPMFKGGIVNFECPEGSNLHYVAINTKHGKKFNIFNG